MGLLAMKKVLFGCTYAIQNLYGRSYFVILSFAPTVGHDYTYFSLKRFSLSARNGGSFNTGFFKWHNLIFSILPKQKKKCDLLCTLNTQE